MIKALLFALLGLICAVSAQAPVGHCHLVGTSWDSGIRGDIFFYPSADGTKITVNVNVSGITQNPDLPHGLHVHQWGNILGSTGLAAGPHYKGVNPDSIHNCDPNVTREEGDMGNWQAVGGVITSSRDFDLLALGGIYSIIGRGVILHNMTDDCTPPIGNSGNRIAQCVIGIANVLPVYLNSTGFSAASNNASAGFENTTVAVCSLIGSTNGYQGVTGTVYFSQASASVGVTVTAVVNGLNGTRGFHVHAFGDLHDLAAGQSLGGHYDYAATGTHALPGNATAHHAGDLGNMCSTDSNGTQYYQYTTPVGQISLVSASNSIIGRAISIHAGRDDGGLVLYGPRVAFCVIGIADPVATNANTGLNIPTIPISTSGEPICDPSTTTTTTTGSTSSTATIAKSTTGFATTTNAASTATASVFAVAFLAFIALF